jgi:hypothetical protein
MSQNTQDFLAKVNMLKTAFPNMTDGELTSLALGNSTFNSNVINGFDNSNLANYCVNEIFKSLIL